MPNRNSLSLLFKPHYGAATATIFLCSLFGMGFANIAKQLENPWSFPYGLVTIIIPMGFGYLADCRPISGKRGVEPQFPGLRGETANSLALTTGVASALGCIAGLINLYIYGALSGDMVLARSIMFDGFQASFFSYAANILMPAGIISIAIAITHYEIMSSTAVALGLVGPLLGQAVLGYFMAGRYIVIALVLLAIWFAVHRPFYGRTVMPKRLLPILVACTIGILIVIGSAYVSVGRSLKDDQAAFALELSKEQIQISPSILWLIEIAPPGLAAVIAEGCLYWSTSIVTFDIAFDSWIDKPNYVGAFSPFLRRRLASIEMVPSETEEWNRWLEISIAHNFYSGTWATTSFDMVKTCGRTGAIFVLAGLGYVTGLIYRRFRESGSIMSLAISAVLWLFFFFWYQRSIFLEPIFEFFIALSIAYLASDLFQSIRSKRGGSRWS